MHKEGPSCAFCAFLWLFLITESCMKNPVMAAIIFATLELAVARAQTEPGTPFRIEKLDPALDEIVASDARLETLGDRFALTEGPVWVPEGRDGFLLFSDNAANVIYKWSPTAPLSVFLEKSGFTGTDNSRVGAQTIAGRVAILLIGSNGLALDPQGRLVVTAMADRTVYRLEKDGMRTVLADRYEGKRFNGPNDIVVKSDGAVYFTDSVWGLRGAANDPAREIPFSGFYLIKDGKVTLLGGDKDVPGTFPNGITLSPDEKYLYVTAGGRRTMRYEIQPDDTVANGRPFVDDGSDGMRVDKKGNLYTTSGGTPGRIQITSPAGKPLGRLHLPQPAGEPRPRVCATNVAFGDADDRGLYITACTHLFRIRLKIAGVRPGAKPVSEKTP
jgi:gluconolactonase